MRVIPVIDLMNGVVVRGVAGRRDEYRPIQSQIAADAQPATVARAFVRTFGVETVYVADLDAIQHGRPNVAAWQQIAAAGLNLWLDAGIGTAAAAWRVLEQLALAEIEARPIVGLESLQSEVEFGEIAELCGPQPPIFSLDLKAGQPLVRNPDWQGLQPLEIAQMALAWGVANLIVLDLADVGTGGGTRTIELCRQIRELGWPGQLIAGGGVRGVVDLQALTRFGCDAVLVASALHDGRLTPTQLSDPFFRRLTTQKPAT
jgi:phosphoribosylformimino-5-aminoimidazole carboxamide ribotide isomerase